MKQLRFILSLAVIALIFTAHPAVADQESSYSDREACISARAERNSLCDQAAQTCLEVHKYEAFNQIRPCAHYAGRCKEALQQEDAVCLPEDNPRITRHPLKGDPIP